MNGNTPLPAAGLIHLNLAGRTFVISRFTFLVIVGAVVGAVTALVTVAFRLSAIGGEWIFFPYRGLPGQIPLFSGAALKRLLMPALGGLLSGILIFKIGKFKGTHGIPAILKAVAGGQSQFTVKMAIPSALATITLATGGSAGPEGPIAEIGSITGSVIGRTVGIPTKMIKTMIGSGVAAGISAVFNAPVAGIFFALEVILRNYEVTSFTPIAIASVVASVITQTLLGDNMAITIAPFSIPRHEWPLFMLLGPLCGLVAVAYIHSLSACHRAIARLHFPLWLKPALGGLAVGLIGIFLPQVMGEGYLWIGRTVAHPVGVGLLLVLIAAKILATGITLGSGNPGGSFAPAVFIGVMLGTGFGVLTTALGWSASPTPYAALGMAGLIGGALGAPFTAIMITLRHTAYRSDIILPLMTTVALGSFVVQRLRCGSVYTHDMLRSGFDLDHTRTGDPLSLVRVSAIKLVSTFEELPPSMFVADALDRCKRSLARWFLVRNEQGRFYGILSIHEMRLAIAEAELGRLLVVSDIADSALPRLVPEMSLRAALGEFSATDCEVLPVFESPDPNAPLLGMISRQDVLNAYYEYTELV